MNTNVSGVGLPNVMQADKLRISYGTNIDTSIGQTFLGSVLHVMTNIKERVLLLYTLCSLLFSYNKEMSIFTVSFNINNMHLTIYFHFFQFIYL